MLLLDSRWRACGGLVILREDEVDQVLVAAGPGLNPKHLGNGCSVGCFELNVVFLNPGGVKQKLLVARWAVGG